MRSSLLGELNTPYGEFGHSTLQQKSLAATGNPDRASAANAL